MRKDLLSAYIKSLKPLILQQMLVYAQDRDVISLAAGLPDTNLFPKSIYSNVATKITNNLNNFQYGPPSAALKEIIINLAAQRGIKCTVDEILITSGGQQALCMANKLFFNKARKVLIDEYTYPGFLQLYYPYKSHLLSVPARGTEGPCLIGLADILHHNNISFYYTIPDGHNPMGNTLCMKDRHKIIELAQKYNTYIVEDDPYGLLYYDKSIPALKSLSDNVIYISSLSKILSPGFRIGWIIASKEIIKKLSYLKDGMDLNTVTFSQQFAVEALKEKNFDHYLHFIRTEYKNKLHIMVKEIQSTFPAATLLSSPKHGMFLWLKVPGMDFHHHFKDIVMNYKVAYIPGTAFTFRPQANSKEFIRLNFTYNDIPQIKEGIHRLQAAINHYL